jgi:antirestriction protein ArdC
METGPMPHTPWRSSAQSRPPADRTSLYEDITNKIIAELEAGRLPWVQPWGSPEVSAPLGMPMNAATGRTYSGINVLILWGAVVRHGYAVQSWLTFRQALGLGGNVRKGERGTTVVYADRFVPGDERQRAHHDGEAPRSVPFLKRFTVFNVEQCEGLPEDVAANAPPVATGLILPQVEELIRATGADVRIGGDRAYYDVAGDFIRVPPPQAFFEPINWHRTALHEIGHYAGVRLGRDLSAAFGTKKYAYEEIVCELSTSFVCAALGIVPTVRHADYIGSWLEVLREDSRAIVRAASQASKAANWLLAFLPGADDRFGMAGDKQQAVR